MKKEVVKLIQSQLNARGLNVGAVDGIAGDKTFKALAKIKEIPTDWPNDRKLIGFVQLLAQENNIDVGSLDGYWGPQTGYAYDALADLLLKEKEPEIWRPEDLPDLNPNNWPKQDPQSELIRFYGNVGENQTRINLPYPHRLSWDKTKTISSFSCHEKVHDSMLKVLTNVLNHYGIDEIKRLRLDLWGGCLNVRQMRGGTKYSMHSWGIAVDYDPDRNPLNWGRDKAAFAQPEYNAWWRFWEEEGWLSLGRTRNFDWMHVQAAKL
ncbi:MAG: hypothetical protein JW731_09170 [Bacteroidales bacterium]|nr:hypothetical protein [Bacteroidales bacterium]